MEAGPEYDPSKIENIFQDFKGRRAGLIKALSTDVDEFFRQCDPEKKILHLYGFPNETWGVSLPAAQVPPEIPEPVLGINFKRVKMSKKEGLTFVAVHSDSWLHSFAFYSAAICGVGKSDRARLFSMMNDLPTVFETVLGSFEKPSKEKSSATTHKSDTSKSPSGFKRGSESDIRASRGRSRSGGRTHKELQIMEAGPEYDPSMVEKIFQDFKGRLAGLIKALTTDVEELFRQCDPEKGNLCLYGFPNGTWEVTLPAEEIPPEIPEPVLGVSFARDGMTKPEKKWVTFVAVHSDSWLHSVAFYSAAICGACKSDRARLFSMINDLPTVFETVLGFIEKTSKEVEDGEGDEELDDDIMCPICYRDYSYSDEYWIICDVCGKWFHYGCADIMYEMKEYTCPFC